MIHYPGQGFTVAVVVEPRGFGISSGEMRLTFNPSAMEVVNLRAGSLLGEGAITGKSVVDNQAGVVELALARAGQTSPPTLSGSLASLDFLVKADAPPGRYPLTLSNLGLANQAFIQIPGISLASGVVDVAGLIPGDINGNGIVDYLDLAILGSAYGVRRGEVRYIEKADLNRDGVINYMDLAILGANYGRGG